MENNKSDEHRPLCGEIFFAYTMKQETFPKDITDYILNISCLLNMQKYKRPRNKYALKFYRLGERAVIDFLYLLYCQRCIIQKIRSKPKETIANLRV